MFYNSCPTKLLNISFLPTCKHLLLTKSSQDCRSQNQHNYSNIQDLVRFVHAIRYGKMSHFLKGTNVRSNEKAVNFPGTQCPTNYLDNVSQVFMGNGKELNRILRRKQLQIYKVSTSVCQTSAACFSEGGKRGLSVNNGRVDRLRIFSRDTIIVWNVHTNIEQLCEVSLVYVQITKNLSQNAHPNPVYSETFYPSYFLTADLLFIRKSPIAAQLRTAYFSDSV